MGAGMRRWRVVLAGLAVRGSLVRCPWPIRQVASGRAGRRDEPLTSAAAARRAAGWSWFAGGRREGIGVLEAAAKNAQRLAAGMAGCLGESELLGSGCGRGNGGME